MEDLKFKTAGQVMKRSNTDRETDFYTNTNKGFAMAINGFRISVQWGPGNYISDMDIRRKMDLNHPMEYKIFGSDDAEVLIWDRDGESIKWDNGDEVVGFCSSDTVARFIGCLINCPLGESPQRALNQIYSAQD